MAHGVLYYGDNLDVLREHVATESVDLIYLDPPFNSNRSYNVLFGRSHGTDAAAQIEAFDDTWTWSHETEALYQELVAGGAPAPVADALQAMRRLVSDGDVLAYLVMMAARLVELHRVLKRTGSLYLHCDPTASHYLKILMDAIFGAKQFRNEIIWQRTASKALMTTRFASNHDVILVYARGEGTTWNPDEAFLPYDPQNLDPKTASKYRHLDENGRRYRLDNLLNPSRDRPNLTYEFMGVTRVWRWTRERMERAFDDGRVVQTAPGRVPQLKRFFDEQRGRPISDVWSDIAPLNSQAAERLGYPTQKPQSLLERIIATSSREGDVILDPFCGCGTSVAAAQALGRQWIGIDVTYIAVDLIATRLRAAYGTSADFEVHGIPRDVRGAEALFRQSPFDFERWAVSLVEGQPNAKQVGDRGIDGVIRFPVDRKSQIGRCLVSVKGGKQINPAMVRDLVGTVDTEHAELGLLTTLREPTRGMIQAASTGRSYVWPVNNQAFPQVQLASVEDLLNGRRPHLPPALPPYLRARPADGRHRQMVLS